MSHRCHAAVDFFASCFRWDQVMAVLTFLNGYPSNIDLSPIQYSQGVRRDLSGELCALAKRTR
jgi:hypothetical protein